MSQQSGFCRDCLRPAAAGEPRCPSCHSPRLLHHAELHKLTIAHVDCDAFYAAVEKRDDPSLRDVPVIVGGGKRGVVSTACYIARIKGVRSAMPMFQALKLCPEARVVKPNMEKYANAGREVRALMQQLTPLVQPLSIDEAFLDLTGTERLHGASAAISLAKLALEVERTIGITVSIGLSYNKFLAKVASDLDKPRGYSVIGKAEALGFLAGQPVGLIWGVGKAMQAELARDGITRIAQLQTRDKSDLMRRYGSMGARLYHLARGEDLRDVAISEETKSIGAETTFNTDISAFAELERILWRLCEKVSRRAKAEAMSGRTVTLKLKSAQFKIKTRATGLADPTNLAERLFAAARPLVQREADGTAYRLIGVALSHLEHAGGLTATTSLDARIAAKARAELAVDRLREKFGRNAVEKGLVFRTGEGE